MEVEPVDPVQMSIYQSNTYKNNISWLHFDNEQRVQEREQVKGPTQSYISSFVPYLTIASGS